MFLSFMITAIRRYALQRQTLRELALLDDRQLADIGLVRGQLRSVVLRQG